MRFPLAVWVVLACAMVAGARPHPWLWTASSPCSQPRGVLGALEATEDSVLDNALDAVTLLQTPGGSRGAAASEQGGTVLGEAASGGAAAEQVRGNVGKKQASPRVHPKVAPCFFATPAIGTSTSGSPTGRGSSSRPAASATIGC